MPSDNLENYLTLLDIRRAARRRDTLLTGAVFLISFVSLIAFGLLDRLTGRSLYLVSAIVVVFGIAYLQAWIRLEVIKGSMELVKNILHLGVN